MTAEPDGVHCRGPPGGLHGLPVIHIAGFFLGIGCVMFAVGIPFACQPDGAGNPLAVHPHAPALAARPRPMEQEITPHPPKGGYDLRL